MTQATRCDIRIWRGRALLRGWSSRVSVGTERHKKEQNDKRRVEMENWAPEHNINYKGKKGEDEWSDEEMRSYDCLLLSPLHSQALIWWEREDRLDLTNNWKFRVKVRGGGRRRRGTRLSNRMWGVIRFDQTEGLTRPESVFTCAVSGHNDLLCFALEQLDEKIWQHLVSVVHDSYIWVCKEEK